MLKISMRYRCLILDHDDTSVESTSEIHYPAHVETMKRMRPDIEPVDLDTWMLKNFNPGVMEYFTGELGFTEAEIKDEYHIWREFNENRNPEFFPGIIELISEFQSKGGTVAVVSHSEEDMIRRHYSVNGNGVFPDIIFGWDYDPAKRKPSVWPVERIIGQYGFSRESMLMVDDLKPGVTMARNAGIRIAGAGWGHSIPEIENSMRKECDYYFNSIPDFSDFLFGEE